MVRKATPALPVPRTEDRALAPFLTAVYDILVTRQGEKPNAFLEGFVTRKELQDGGVVTYLGGGIVSGGGSSSGGVPSEYTDVTIPPQPTGFSGSGAFRSIILQWDNPQSAYSNHAYTEVWRSASDDFGTAIIMARAGGRIYVDVVDTAQTYFYWIRWVSHALVISPLAPGTSGLEVSTSEDPAYVKSVLAAAITESELYAALNTRIDYIDTPTTGLLDRMTSTEGDVVTAQSDITTLQSQMTTANGNITTNASAITGLDTRVTTAEGTITSQGSAITALQSDLTDAESNITANAGAITTLQTNVSTNAGNISANASAITTVQTRVDQKITYAATAPGSPNLNDLWIETDNDNFAWRWNGSSWVDGADARIGANAASIATNISSIDGLETQWTVKSDINGYVTGVGLASSSRTSNPDSSFIVNAESFAITHPSQPRAAATAYSLGEFVIPTTGTTGLVYEVTTAGTTGGGGDPTWPTIVGNTVADGSVVFTARTPAETVPFIVSGGVAYMDAAMIVDASIVNAKIATLSADKLFVASGTIADAIIGAADITNAMIGDVIQSASYDPGVDGWKIDKAGGIEVHNLTVYDGAGNILMQSGSNIDWSKIGGSGKPADNADVTSANTAAGIAGQGAFATLDQVTAANISTYMASAAIGTLYLAGQAVTIPVSTYSTAGVYCPQDTWTTVASATIASSGAPIQIVAGLSSQDTGNANADGWIRILRGATNLTGTIVGGRHRDIITYGMADTPGSGTVTYYLQFYPAGDNAYSYNNTMLLLETKK